MASGKERKERKCNGVPSLRDAPTLLSSKKPDFSVLTQYILRRFVKGKYDKLRQELVLHHLQEKIDVFFLQEGRILLKFSLIDALDDGALKLLIDTIPIPALKKVLTQDNFSALKSYLLGQVGAEKAGLYNQKRGETQIAKFKGLLMIDKESVINFMKSNVNDAYLQTDKIKKNFEKAIEEFTKENESAKVFVGA